MVNHSLYFVTFDPTLTVQWQTNNNRAINIPGAIEATVNCAYFCFVDFTFDTLRPEVSHGRLPSTTYWKTPLEFLFDRDVSDRSAATTALIANQD